METITKSELKKLNDLFSKKDKTAANKYLDEIYEKYELTKKVHGIDGETGEIINQLERE